MKLWNKIYVHPLTLFFILLCFLCGLGKYLIYILLIISIHEMGHVFFFKVFKRNINRIVLFPTGGIIYADSLVSSNIFEDLLISIGGILFQTLFGFVLLYFGNLISERVFSFLDSYNKIIIIFNLVPIIPLDGSKIVKLLCELFMPFKKTIWISLFLSMGILFIVLIFNTQIVVSNPFIFIFLISMIVLEYKSFKYILTRFYIERMTRKFNYPLINIETYTDMYKNKVHNIDGVFESEYLRDLFTLKS